MPRMRADLEDQEPVLVKTHVQIRANVLEHIESGGILTDLKRTLEGLALDHPTIQTG